MYYGTIISAAASVVDNGHRYNLIWDADPILVQKQSMALDEITITSNKTSTLYITEIFVVSGIVENDDYGSISGSSSQKVLYGNDLQVPFSVSAKDGYYFTEWSSLDNVATVAVGPSGYPEVSNIAKDCQIEAHFDEIEYTVTVSVNGIRNTINYTISSPSFTLENPSRENYDFIGWTGSNGSTPEETITIEQGTTGNKTYVANFRLKTVEIETNTFSPVILIAIIGGSILALIGTMFIILFAAKRRRKKQEGSGTIKILNK